MEFLIYLDVCCLNRPFDDQTQERIRLEVEAVLRILVKFQIGDRQLLGSEAFDDELENTPEETRKWQMRL
ncbi:hypothetical protein NIES4075_25880 [Tolypothrix sp. NIES-4075]|uniref:hypothetical protein n=1 Tax=Tolypothrix sp. NIES-4075 TaxID=2005459 RepID=UPI000B5C9F6D|nr:hypothetical protein [Tolypothrix sp. NIES-4075]GAX41591.1 hypothetical protein NIES4075_25880 [Tolypothrix sp. NIES-4075]